MAVAALGPIGRRVRAVEQKDAIVVELGVFPGEGGVTGIAELRAHELTMLRWVGVAVLHMAADTASGRVDDQVVSVAVGADWPVGWRLDMGAVEREGVVMIERRFIEVGDEDGVAAFTLDRHDPVAGDVHIGSRLVCQVTIEALCGGPVDDAQGVAVPAGGVGVLPLEGELFHMVGDARRDPIVGRVALIARGV